MSGNVEFRRVQPTTSDIKKVNLDVRNTDFIYKNPLLLDIRVVVATHTHVRHVWLSVIFRLFFCDVWD